MKLNEILDEHRKWLSGDGGKRANLRGANLRWADLSEADLRWADLSEANLSEADLRGADLSEANLSEADLRGADLRWAELPQKIIQIGPIGSRNDYTVYNVNMNTVSCGCWNNYEGGSLEDFKARIDNVYPSGKHRTEYLAAISAFEMMRAAENQKLMEQTAPTIEDVLENGTKGE